MNKDLGLKRQLSRRVDVDIFSGQQVAVFCFEELLFRQICDRFSNNDLWRVD
jgi:hypothetical protein